MSLLLYIVTWLTLHLFTVSLLRSKSPKMDESMVDTLNTFEGNYLRMPKNPAKIICYQVVASQLLS
jgi:hypothetical protein